jgi:hypothetical protein
MKPIWICGVVSVAVMSLAALAQPALGGLTKCKMEFSLAGWSVFYSTANGSGTITCDNGQSARVSLRAKGGGLTPGSPRLPTAEARSRRSVISANFSGATLLWTSTPGRSSRPLRRW